MRVLLRASQKNLPFKATFLRQSGKSAILKIASDSFFLALLLNSSDLPFRRLLALAYSAVAPCYAISAVLDFSSLRTAIRYAFAFAHFVPRYRVSPLALRTPKNPQKKGSLSKTPVSPLKIFFNTLYKYCDT